MPDPLSQLKLSSADYYTHLNDPKYFGRPGSKLNAELIAEAAKAYNLDPRLLAAITANESAWGTSSNAVKANNFSGMMGAGNKLFTYKTPAEGMRAAAENLHRNYIRKGLTTPATIGPKYAPTTTATNDPSGINKNWIDTVTSIQKRIPEYKVPAQAKQPAQLVRPFVGPPSSAKPFVGPPRPTVQKVKTTVVPGGKTLVSTLANLPKS